MSDTSSDTVTVPRRAPTLAGFFALGLFWGAWAAVLPSVQHATGTSKGALGVALLFVSVGSIPVMFFIAPRTIERFGARAVAVGCTAFAVATLLPGLATSLPALVLALAACGMASGLVDVAINANIGRIENATGKRLQPLAHGTYSTGVLVGAVGAGLARGAGSGREPILIAVSIVIALTALVVSGDHASVHTERSHGLRFAPGLVLIGVVGAVAFVVEGGTENWSALFLERQLHAHPAVSGLGPGVFAASMASGRFLGQAASRFSNRALLSGGAALAAVGCLVAASAPNAAVGLVGFALAGAGIALNAPIVFGVAGRHPDAATAVATVTTIGYVGLLVGPPLVGLVAQASSLRVSFVVLAVVAAAVAAAATRLQLD
ncbi:MAG TPA: MFS transporter [Gaiellaceae bacterium]|nr:MFS transporter [Gaiellaceae bacterium]